MDDKQKTQLMAKRTSLVARGQDILVKIEQLQKKLEGVAAAVAALDAELAQA